MMNVHFDEQEALLKKEWPSLDKASEDEDAKDTKNETMQWF